MIPPQLVGMDRFLAKLPRCKRGDAGRCIDSLLLVKHREKEKKGLTKIRGCHIIVLLVRADWRDGRVVYGAGLENQ